MKKLLVLLAVFASPAAAQTVAVLPSTCNPSGFQCTVATPVVNPDGTLIGSGGGSATRTTAAGTSDTQAVPVQGVTNGVPQNVAQSGTWNLNNITGTISLPTNAATAPNQTSMLAKMPALGTAGTPSADVISVQGVANGTPQNTTQRGVASLATGQVSIGTSSTLLVAARTTAPLRQRVTISVGAANTCAFGNTGVTTTTGFPLQPVAGATITLDTTAAIYAACSATTTVSYLEQF